MCKVRHKRSLYYQNDEEGMRRDNIRRHRLANNPVFSPSILANLFQIHTGRYGGISDYGRSKYMRNQPAGAGLYYARQKPKYEPSDETPEEYYQEDEDEDYEEYEDKNDEVLTLSAKRQLIGDLIHNLVATRFRNRLNYESSDEDTEEFCQEEEEDDEGDDEDDEEGEEDEEDEEEEEYGRNSEVHKLAAKKQLLDSRIRIPATYKSGSYYVRNRPNYQSPDENSQQAYPNESREEYRKSDEIHKLAAKNHHLDDLFQTPQKKGYKMYVQTQTIKI